MDDRLTPAWSPLEALLIALIVLMGTFLSGVLLGTLLGRRTGAVLAALAFEALLALVTVAWVRARQAPWREPLGVGARPTFSDLAFGVGAGLGISVVVTTVVAPALFWLLSLITGEPVVPPQQEVLPANPSGFHLAITGVSVIVAAPVGEELFFRGFLYGSLRARTGAGVAALVSSAVFAVTHSIPLLMPLLFVVGLGLAWIYEQRRSLWPAMAAHAAFNLVGYVLIAQRT